ncbi:peptidyl-prolyl cis-trans isomerase [Lachnospiraceae bacterium 29-84]
MKAKKILPVLLAAALGMSVLGGCGNAIDGNKTGATLNGEEVSLGFMNFMARYQQAVYDGQLGAMFGTTMWGQDLFGEGTDMETSVKNSVAENIQTLYLLEDHMADYKVEITEDELAKMDEAAGKFIEGNSKAAIRQLGATKEYVKEMLRLNTIQVKMRAEMDKEVDTEVSDDEAAQKTISYVQVNNQSRTDDDGKSIDYTEEEKEVLRQDVEAFAQNAADDFTAAAETAGYTVTPYSYGADEESLDASVKEAADKLKEGEVSEVITTDTSYYVVHMDSLFDEEATEKKKEEIVTTRKNDHYTEVCDGYKEDVKFELNEEEWAKVKFDEFFTMKQVETDEAEHNHDTDDADAAEGAEDGTDAAEDAAGTDAAKDTEDGTDAAEDAAEGTEDGTDAAEDAAEDTEDGTDAAEDNTDAQE